MSIGAKNVRPMRWGVRLGLSEATAKRGIGGAVERRCGLVDESDRVFRVGWGKGLGMAVVSGGVMTLCYWPVQQRFQQADLARFRSIALRRSAGGYCRVCGLFVHDTDGDG